MAYSDPGEIQRWQEETWVKESAIRGDIVAMQPYQCDEGSMTSVKVIVREDQNVNTVSTSCIDKFSPSSWKTIDIQKPVHGEKIELNLEHDSYRSICRFEFLVDENESYDIVVGGDAYKVIQRKWCNENGPISVILWNKKKGDAIVSLSSSQAVLTSDAAGKGLPIDHAVAAAVTASDRERDKVEEQRQRKAHRDASSRRSLDSADTTPSGTSTNSTAPSH